MGRALSLAIVIATLVFPAASRAADFSFQGYADLRLVFPSQETSWLKGGLGKFRYSGDGAQFRFAEAAGQATLALGDEFHLVGVGRIEPRDRAGIDALEFYGSYHPHVEDWDIGLKAGAFFPPFSLENTDLGWTSPYTITPSTINSWVGHELRTIGSELRIAHDTPIGRFSLTASLFCCNDPAGVLIANGGWTLDDRYSGLFETLPEAGSSPLSRTPVFRELDNRPGWYAGMGWNIRGAGTLSIYRYNNDANDEITRGTASGWRTKFWSGGWESHFGSVSLLAQAMIGSTVIEFPGAYFDVNFESSYILASYDWSDWRLSGRVESFSTQAEYGGGENGNAFTAALSWMPKDWLRITTEVIALDSRRDERIIEGLAPRQSQVQEQTSLRVFF